MESQQRKKLVETAKVLLHNGLQAPLEQRTTVYTKKNIMKATQIYKDEVKREIDEKIAEFDLQIKQLQKRRKDAYAEIIHRRNLILKRFLYYTDRYLK